jgi:diguanylate cyclase (GGDEF)-like protein
VAEPTATSGAAGTGSGGGGGVRGTSWMRGGRVAVLAAAAATLWVAAVRHLPAVPGPVRVPWPLFALGFAATASFAPRVELRNRGHSFSLGGLPLVTGLYLLAPNELVLAGLAGSLLALGLRREPPGRLAFNLSLVLLQTCLAVTVFARLAGERPLGPRGWAAALLATLSADLLAGLAAPLLRQGGARARTLLEGAGAAAAATAASASLGLVAVLTLTADPRAAGLLLVLGGVLLLAYRGHRALRERHQRLRRLYAFTQEVSRAGEVDATVLVLLEQASALLRAEHAEVLLRERPDGGGRLVRRGADGSVEVAGVSSGGSLMDVPGGRAAVHPRPMPDGRARAEAAGRGLHDAVVTALTGPDGPLGVLLVGNRRGGAATFGPEDGRLLETLAGQAAVALDKARLIHRLRTEKAERTLQALHDPLTGLGNRRRFLEELAEAVEAGPSVGLTVLLLDLDRFKEINDNLGRGTGDGLLLEVAERLVAAVGGVRLAARIGGDEFAVLAAGSDPAEAIRVAERLRAVVAQPVRMDGIDLSVAASVGIARWPQDGGDPDNLLQRAEVAMYQAKAGHSGIEVYDEARDPSSADRLAIVADLRAVIDAGELTVWYRPKADAASGRLVGAEALVRWPHPVRGMLPTDELVATAEQAGLIGRLTRLVLGEALAACQRWRAAGLDLGVTVNTSTRDLLGSGLVEHVAGLLAATGLPAPCVTLEITEGHVVADPDRAAPVLQRLRDLGVHLSVDDFGTGYSSLGYLRGLPVDEVKIDRSLVTGMATDAVDAGIVEAAVTLGRCLGLQVVAEGVESEDTRLRLAAMGCHVVQGFLVGRPMPADELLRRAADGAVPDPAGPLPAPDPAP